MSTYPNRQRLHYDDLRIVEKGIRNSPFANSALRRIEQNKFDTAIPTVRRIFTSPHDPLPHLPSAYTSRRREFHPYIVSNGYSSAADAIPGRSVSRSGKFIRVAYAIEG